MPLLQTSGNDTADAYGGGVAAVPNYIEDVFSTYLYTGTSVDRSITNGIDLAGKGGLVWIKNRTPNAESHNLFDTDRGALKYLFSNLTNAQSTGSNGLSAFNSDGFSLLGASGSNNYLNSTYASWTFRKQPKFFDVVTYTGNGIAGRTVSHSLGSVPGCMFVKRLDTTGAWQVYHTWLGGSGYAVLNTTAAAPVSNTRWNNENPTSTVFTLGSDVTVNANGGTYVAYLFASNAGGFGLTGTDNVITCADYTGNGSATGPVITLGYEPQWILIKNATAVGDWNLIDNMRGFVVGGTDSELNPNLSSAESTGTFVTPTATGFQINTTDTGYNSNGQTYIYIAIRRGPMKVPTSGTSVYTPISTSAATGTAQTTNFPVDFQLQAFRSVGAAKADVDRLRGVSTTSTEVGTVLYTNLTNAESSSTGSASNNWGNTGFAVPSDRGGVSSIYWNFRRAPGFFDEVCYTGTGANATWSHNLGAVPEMMIVKKRGGVANWAVYHSALGAAGYAILNTTAASTTSSTFWQSTTPTATSFYTGTNGNVGDSGLTYVAYLFATCPGVSKVGSYTGNGSSQTINCGFTGGARFVLIKRTDTTGSWYVWDTARGMVAGTDPSIAINAAGTDSNVNDVYTTGVGFQLVSAFTGSNASGGTYIYLAIA